MIRFCGHCAAALPGPPPVDCEHCGRTTFLNAKPSASAVVLHRNRFLAVRRRHEPAAGRWDLPGGFCDGPEHPADTAVREVLEETGLRVELGPLLGLYTGDYAYQGDTAPTVNAYYLAHLHRPDQELRTTEETTDVDWFDLHTPPPMAFEHQKHVLHDADARR